MRTITNSFLKAVALNYYNAGKLTAQAPAPNCVLLDNDGYRCAIGAALTLEEIAKAPYPGLVYNLHGRIVQFEDPDFADAIQRAHDRWANSQMDRDFGDPDETKATFLELLK